MPISIYSIHCTPLPFSSLSVSGEPFILNKKNKTKANKQKTTNINLFKGNRWFHVFHSINGACAFARLQHTKKHLLWVTQRKIQEDPPRTTAACQIFWMWESDVAVQSTIINRRNFDPLFSADQCTYLVLRCLDF